MTVGVIYLTILGYGLVVCLYIQSLRWGSGLVYKHKDGGRYALMLDLAFLPRA